ncbi:MAG: DUF4131 domain-containing protein, partial [Elusimicrobia bacterium]|nr:DUF4131 domain-containing protein [Elusimicrobiota bacterium]
MTGGFSTQSFPTISPIIDNKFWDRTGIKGIVIREPDVRPDKTNLTVRPFQIKKKGKWRTLEGKTGNVLVQVKPAVGDYYKTCDYGDIIEVNAALLQPMKKSNPGAFDYA